MRTGGTTQDLLAPMQYGLHYGIVCQNTDDEQQLNRIKVRFPWLDGGGVDRAHWAQLLTPMEGDQFGWYTVPDVDDVVVVAFIMGDISQPVILGGVWSAPDFSPETNEDGKNNFRGYRSRSGHRLILDDSDKPKAVVADKTGHNVLGIGAFDKAGVGPNVCALYKPPGAGDGGVALSCMTGDLQLTCKNGQLSITARRHVQIESQTTIAVSSGRNLELDGRKASQLTASRPASYDASTINIG
jgi:uncharacterized protein involved in type VI secretion and phage assembly